MKKNKIFTIGGATFDIFIKPNNQAVMRLNTPTNQNEWLCLQYGGKIKIDHVTETFGGGATNNAISFARMGFDANCICKIGAEYGDKVINNLQQNNVNTTFVKKTSRDKTAFSTIINTYDGERTVLAYPGANHFFTAKDLSCEDIAKADWIFLNHLTEKNSQIPKVLLSILKKNPNIKLAWNPGNEQLSAGVKKWRALLERTEILFVNKEEAELFTRKTHAPAGVKKDDPRFHGHIPSSFLPPYADDVSEIMLEFFKYGVKKVVITDGRNGAQASDGKRLYFCPVISHKRIDTLGAGDSFASGFTSAVMRGKNLKTALIYGTLNASSVVSHFGAQKGLLTHKELEDRIKHTNLAVTSTKLK